jgi:hypothetical protein
VHSLPEFDARANILDCGSIRNQFVAGSILKIVKISFPSEYLPGLRRSDGSADEKNNRDRDPSPGKTAYVSYGIHLSPPLNNESVAYT